MTCRFLIYWFSLCFLFLYKLYPSSFNVVWLMLEYIYIYIGIKGNNIKTKQQTRFRTKPVNEQTTAISLQNRNKVHRRTGKTAKSISREGPDLASRKSAHLFASL